jgi:phosphatidylserine/phosphatidylglycerophosphate/cardiolipin synthase-like enzyme
MAAKDKYMFSDADRQDGSGVYEPHYPVPVLPHNGTVVPLIDGEAYFDDLYAAMEALAGDVSKQGICLANWLFWFEFEIQPGISMVDYLKAKAAAGVDVRVLAWVNEYLVIPIVGTIGIPEALEYGGTAAAGAAATAAYYRDIGLDNLRTIIELRKEPALADKVQANTLDANAGSVHMKFALVYDENKAFGYTGGIDLDNSRRSDTGHFDKDNRWHDIMAKVVGEAVQPFYDHFASLWNELEHLGTNAASLGYTVPRFYHPTLGVKVDGTSAGITAMAANTMSWGGVIGNNYVQSLRTLPHKTRDWSAVAPADSLDFQTLPAKGVYEIQLAIKTAIGNATKYVYIEDQAVWSREIFGYLKDALKANDELVVIILTGQFDPTEPQDEKSWTIWTYLVDDLSPSERARLGIFIHSVATVHSKLFLVDDEVAIIGSAGMFNRALFVEIEHAIAFVDVDSTTTTVKDFRKALWAEHFRAEGYELDQVDAIEDALHIWNPNWYSSAPATTWKLPHYATSRIELPLASRTLGSESVPKCLVEYKVFWDGGAWVYWSDRTKWVAGTVNLISDTGLPVSTDLDLNGEWILVTSGPNDDEWAIITSHVGQSIHFRPMPNANDSTTEYDMYQSVIKPVDVGFIAPSNAEYYYFFETIKDIGELPS